MTVQGHLICQPTHPAMLHCKADAWATPAPQVAMLTLSCHCATRGTPLAELQQQCPPHPPVGSICQDKYRPEITWCLKHRRCLRNDTATNVCIEFHEVFSSVLSEPPQNKRLIQHRTLVMPKRKYFLNNVQQIIIPFSILDQQESQAGLALWAQDATAQPASLRPAHVSGRCTISSCQSWVDKCPGHRSADSGVCTVSSVSGTRKISSHWGPADLLGVCAVRVRGSAAWRGGPG